VAALLARIDIFCLPARIAADGDRDGLPNVILEAMAAGCAVVATDVAAVGEALEDQRTGLLVPVSDPDALARAIAELARDPRRRASMGAAAREMVQERFASEAGMDRLAGRLRAEIDRACA